MTEKLVILGSTGSIGRQTLEVAEALGLPVSALSARGNIDLLEIQARQFRPKAVAVLDAGRAGELKLRLADTQIRVLSGPEGQCEIAAMDGADTVVTAVVGIAGLLPTLAAVRAGKRIALANKETLVCAGELVMTEARRCNAEILPVDSEHSALFQCLQGNRDRGAVKRLILTASGGPFFGMSRAQLTRVTKQDALRHPNWTMGPKITVDSATLMNKGLEFIEAMRLYSMPPEKIEVAVHRESIIHSMVEYCDGAVLAQLGAPDMRLPIQYALTHPARLPGVARTLDILSCPPLTFAAPDEETFACLALAKTAARTGGTATAVLNGANEAAVARFLAGEIGFLEIAQCIEAAMAAVPPVPEPALEDILEADRAARLAVKKIRGKE